eukprot:811078-Pyramimonas_sp.AAC.1
MRPFALSEHHRSCLEAVAPGCRAGATAFKNRARTSPQGSCETGGLVFLIQGGAGFGRGGPLGRTTCPC